MPQLLERCGTSERGTITGFYTILVEGDDLDEPVSDAVRGILDGHVVLSRQLASRYHYPAIDVLGSVSRLEPRICDPLHRKAAGIIRRLLAVYRDSEDLINTGIYTPGSNDEVDEAIRKRPEINGLLQQEVEERNSVAETRDRLLTIAEVETDAGVETTPKSDTEVETDHNNETLESDEEINA